MLVNSSHFHNGKSGSALTIKVIPQSNTNKLTEILDDGTLIIKIDASLKAEDVNNALVKYLNEILDVPKNHIEIIAGNDRTEKLIGILDSDPNDIQTRIMNYMLSLE